MKLYEITHGLVDVEALLVESGGEITPDIEQRLDMLEGALHEKVDRIAGLVRQMTLMASAAKSEQERIAALRATREKAAKRLQDYLLRCMQQAGRDKVDTPRFVVSVREASRPAIRWTLEKAIPKRFRRTVPAQVVLDADAALQELKAKGKLPTGFTWDTTKYLNIK